MRCQTRKGITICDGWMVSFMSIFKTTLINVVSFLIWHIHMLTFLGGLSFPKYVGTPYKLKT
jgi:hypothetical protein